MTTPYSLGVHINASGGGNAATGLLGAAANAAKLGQQANTSSRGVAGLRQRLSGLGTSNRVLQGLYQRLQGFHPMLSGLGDSARAWGAENSKSMLGTLNPMRLHQMYQERIRQTALKQAEAFQTAKTSLGAFQDKAGRWRHSRGRYLSIGELESIGVRKAMPTMRGFGQVLSGLGGGTRGLGNSLRGLGGNTQFLGKQLHDLGGGARGAGRFFDGMNSSLGISQGLMYGLGAASVGAAAGMAAIVKSGFDLNITKESDISAIAATLASVYEFRSKITGKALDSSEEFTASLTEAKKIYQDLRDMSLGAPGTTQDLMQVFKASVGPAGQAGATLKEIQDLTIKAVGAAKAIGGKPAFPNMEIAARDMRQLLSGAASAADTPMFQILSNQIRMTTEEFNKLPPPERFRVLAKALNEAVTPAVLKNYKAGWEGITESLDEYKQRAEEAFSKELFDRSKKTLGNFVEFLGTNQAEIVLKARQLGTGLADGFELGLGVVQGVLGWADEQISPILDYFNSEYQKTQKLFGETGMLKDAGEGWRIIGDALVFVGGGLLQLIAGTAGFIGLGAGTVFTGIGLAAKKLGDNIAYIRTEWEKLGGGFEGAVKLLENSWDGFKALMGQAQSDSEKAHLERVTQHQASNQKLLESMGLAKPNPIDPKELEKARQLYRNAYQGLGQQTQPTNPKPRESTTLKPSLGIQSPTPFAPPKLGDSKPELDLKAPKPRETAPPKTQLNTLNSNINTSRETAPKPTLTTQNTPNFAPPKLGDSKPVLPVLNLPMPQIPPVVIPDVSRSNRKSETMVQNTVNQTNNITQTIQAPDPERAANAANAGIARAAATPFPADVTGQPVTNAAR